jgi:hypothetical protein
MRNRFLTLVAIGLLSSARAASAAEAICGDVNKSGTLTTADALSVLKASVGQTVNLQCPAPATPLVSGQVECYDDGGSPISCAGTGQDGELREGVLPALFDNGNGTITDSSTGLVWEKISDDDSIHDQDNVYSWTEALERIDSLNEQAFAGFSDWRLPNIVEARTILDHSRFGPAVDPIFDKDCVGDCTVFQCNCIQPDWYWTSTSYEESPADAWFVDVYNGYTDFTGKEEVIFARAVRGGL